MWVRKANGEKGPATQSTALKNHKEIQSPEENKREEHTVGTPPEKAEKESVKKI